MIHPHTVLFILPEGREGCVLDSVCNARVPFVNRSVCPTHGTGHWCVLSPHCAGCQFAATDVLAAVAQAGGRRIEMALALVWEGEVVPMGCDRLARILGKPLATTYSLETARRLCYDGQQAGLGNAYVLEVP